MKTHTFLKRIFRAYYSKEDIILPEVKSLRNRECGFIPWDKQIMIRHMEFSTIEEYKKFLIDMGPRHCYVSGADYKNPGNTEMNAKGFLGCDFLIDIDVDHFYTPCKDTHDFWYCKECGESGKGMKTSCTNCKSSKLSSLSWICEECLDIAKNEIKKLVYDFLSTDFLVNEEDIQVVFSGHRGYHLKISSDVFRSLKSEERREIVNYLSGENLSLEIMGLREVGGFIYGFSKRNIGWAEKIITKIEQILTKYTDTELTESLKRIGFSKNYILSFVNSKDDFLKVIQGDSYNIWSIEGFSLKNWTIFLDHIVYIIGVKIDQPVSIDLHRLIRYPGTLHGKSGFKVQELELGELEDFSPLDESNEQLDPIVFAGESTHKIQIIAQTVPVTTFKGQSFGPYFKDEIISVPNHVAIFLLCKDVARLL